jgi:hypothetical protein
MKKLQLLVLALIGTTATALAQIPVKTNEVPPAVLKTYYSQNSRGAKDSLWVREIITVYKVSYIDDGTRYEAQYFENGDWIKTFNEVPMEHVPMTVINQLSTLYPGYKVVKTFNELNNDGKFYVLDIEKGKDKMSIYFTPSGKFFK